MATATRGPARGATRPAPGAPAAAKTALLPESVRLFCALAGIGAAALTFGLSSNLVAAGVQGMAGAERGYPVLEFSAAFLVAGWAVLLLLWAVQSLRHGGLAWPGALARVLPVGAAVQLAVLVYGLWQLPAGRRSFDLTSASAVVLELAILASAGWLRRQHSPAAPVSGWKGSSVQTTTAATAAPSAPPAGRLLAAMFASAVLVSAVATAGLAATAAGHFAVPHGEHGAHSSTGPDPAQHHH